MFEYDLIPVTIMKYREIGGFQMKKTCIFTLLFLFILTPVALGHSGLSSSNPATEEIMKDEVQSVSLRFNTTIENTSMLKVINADGVEMPIEKTLINVDEMVGKLEKPLAKGKYMVRWKIIGKDGHPIEGEFSFSVELVKNANSEVTKEKQHEEMIPTPIEKPQKETIKSKKSNFVVIVMAILLTGIAFGTALVLFKKERRK